MIKQFIKDWRQWNWALRRYFFFCCIPSFVVVFPLVVFGVYRIPIDFKYVIGALVVWIISFPFVRKGTLRKCEEQGYVLRGEMKSRENGLGYRCLAALGFIKPTMARKTEEKKLKKFKEFMDKRRDKHNPDKLIKEFLEKGG